jgi:hypothetical protein
MVSKFCCNQANDQDRTLSLSLSLSLSLHLMTKTISLALVDLLQMLAEEPRRSHKTRTKQHVPRLCWLQTAAWSFPPAIRHGQLLRTLTEIHDKAINQMEQHFDNDHLPWTALPWEFTGSIGNSGAGNYSGKDGRLFFFNIPRCKRCLGAPPSPEHIWGICGTRSGIFAAAKTFSPQSLPRSSFPVLVYAFLFLLLLLNVCSDERV